MTKAKVKRKKENLPHSSDSVTVQTSEENGQPNAKSKKKHDSSPQTEERNLQIMEDESDIQVDFDFSKFSEMRFGLYPNADFISAYSALVVLEQDLARLIVATKVTSGNSDPHAVALQYLDPAEITRKTILMGFPLKFSLDMLERLPNVLVLKRYRLLKTITRQVPLTVKGPISSKIDLGKFGTYKAREYTPEPLRCFRCQRFGHHKDKAPPRCAIYARNHETSPCLTKMKEAAL